jgi:hypothetical protein
MRTSGVRTLLVIAHVLVGPFCAGLVFIALHFGFSDGSMLLRPGSGGESPPINLLVDYIKLTPIFYAPGFLPALTTGFLTGSRVQMTGRCNWLRAATYGAAASVILVGAPSLIFVSGAATSWQIGYPATIVAMLAFQAVLGFVGTIPVWLMTGGLRRRLAAARASDAAMPAAAA